MKPFHSLLQMIDTLHTEEDCRLYLEDMRWHGEPVCPHCGSISKHHYKLTQKESSKVYTSVKIVGNGLRFGLVQCLKILIFR